MEILTEEDSSDLAGCQETLSLHLQRLRAEWAASSESLSDLLRTDSGVSRAQKALSPENVEALLEDLRPLANEALLPSSTIHAILRLNPEKIAMKKKAPGPLDHPFLRLCQEFDELTATYSRLIRSTFIEFSRRELPAAKQRRNILTFDDLLNRLYETLRGPGGEVLRQTIGNRFAAALIDEFQDTDPVQWKIFQNLFGNGRHILYLIGDPKQAIYAFRGADIFTYLEARRSASNHYTLGKNWRSDRQLIEAANSLFARSDLPFVFPEIAFQAVESAADGEGELNLGDSGLAPQPLQLICLSDDDGEKLSAENAREMAIEMLVTEISQLLTCGVQRKNSPIEPGDIAILVRSNREAEAVRQALVEHGIPGVVRTDQSVLQSAEADHILRLLAAILEPHKNGLAKAALASPLFGLTADDIHNLDTDESAWQDLAEKFHGWQETWNRHGFMRMFRTFLQGEKVRERILAHLDGERILTNLQHAGECLHQAEFENGFTPAALLRWLREQMERPEGNNDAQVIRLEKDEKAVQIVTIHRSKGLEYPIVFCPFNWTTVPGTAKSGSSPDILFHDPENEYRLTWDQRQPPADENVAAFRREQLAEAVRLLYVAVTRARNRCYLFWADTRDSSSSANCALAHIFGCDADETQPLSPLAAFTQIVDNQCTALFQSEQTQDHNRYRLPKVDAGSLRSLTVTRPLPGAPLITSFSGLTAKAEEIHPDRDIESTATVADVVDPGAPDGVNIFTFPKGARAGLFFHSLLEELDFTDAESIEGKVEELSRRFKIEERFRPVVKEQIQALLHLTLPRLGGFRLADLQLSDRLIEASFYFPIRPVPAPRLASLFEEEPNLAAFSKNLGRLDYRPVEGYMTGFIDMVFRHHGRYYLIDWKSNWLGSTVDAYHPEALRETMAASFYYLQYHLYALALDRHLARTLPGYAYAEHFGGVFYIFLRGLDSQNSESGIFFDRPSEALIKRLHQTLLVSDPHLDFSAPKAP
jgi:exodeoxyribonuclease V beta subunit